MTLSPNGIMTYGKPKYSTNIGFLVKGTYRRDFGDVPPVRAFGDLPLGWQLIETKSNLFKKAR